MHDAHLGCAFLFLDILAAYIAVNESHGYSMSLVCSWNEVGDVHVKFPQAPFAYAPFGWDLARHLQSPKNRNPEKSQKVSRKEFGTPRPRTPEKFRKKSEKSEKKSKSIFFLTFRTFFGTFWGSGVGGSQTPLGRETERKRESNRERERERTKKETHFLLLYLPPSLFLSLSLALSLSLSLSPTPLPRETFLRLFGVSGFWAL